MQDYYMRIVTLTKEAFGGEVELNVECSWTLDSTTEPHGETIVEKQDLAIGDVTFNNINPKDTAIEVLASNGIHSPTDSIVTSMVELLKVWIKGVTVKIDEVEDYLD